MACIAATNYTAPFTAPYVNATRLWAQGVEMQMAMTRCWFDMARMMNPMLPAFDVHKLSAPHKPAAKPATTSRKPRAARPPARPAAAKAAPAPAPAAEAAPAPAKAEVSAPETVRAKPAAKRQPATRTSRPKAAAKPAARRTRKAPSKPEQPFKD